MFHMKINLILKIDKCEGVLNPCEICHRILQVGKTDHFLGNSYIIECLFIKEFKTPMVQVRRRKMGHMCIKIQSIVTSDQLMCDIVLNKRPTFGVLGNVLIIHHLLSSNLTIGIFRVVEIDENV